MSRRRAALISSTIACILLVSATDSKSEEIEHKFRIAFSAGGTQVTDQQHSPSANVRTLLKPNGEFETFLQDPRNDSAAFSDFGLEPQVGVTLSASYAFTRQWYLEGSVGARRGKVGNIELQAQFQGALTTPEQPFNFTIFNIDAGTIRQIPVQVTAGIRFRPKAAFNPFLCGGIGYSFNSFTPSAELNDLSTTLDSSTGAFRSVTQAGGGFGSAGPSVNLSGFTVDAPSAPEWHVGGGFEYAFASRWVVFVDARYTVYSGRFHLTVNGGDELGISVPSDQRFTADPDALGPFGAFDIIDGGLVDGGSLVPAPGFPNADCSAGPINCEFTGPRDGVKDPGIYYIHAGRVRYDNGTLQIGFKFTF